jgi:hypothetical protein
MKKRLLLCLITFLMALPVSARKVDVLVLWVHYSVGSQFVDADCDIRIKLDALNVTVGNDTANIVFRDYYSNRERADEYYTALGDTSFDSINCRENKFSGFDYDLRAPYNRIRINASEDGTTYLYADILRYLFQVPHKEDSLFWKVFTTHNVPGSSGDSVTVKYDLIIVKNPYSCWFRMSQALSDSIKIYYRVVRDSLVNHPEINFVFAFGTPLHLGHEVFDSSQAKITYDLATWFMSDDFFTHSNSGPYKNIWKWDSYRFLCETSPGAINRYCLKDEYFPPGETASHLSALGARVAQDSLVAFIARAAEDILIQKANLVTRRDIDLKILEFRRGEATVDDVIELIETYNNGSQ